MMSVPLTCHSDVLRVVDAGISVGNPLRQPLTICSMVNSATSAPQIGIAM